MAIKALKTTRVLLYLALFLVLPVSSVNAQNLTTPTPTAIATATPTATPEALLDSGVSFPTLIAIGGIGLILTLSVGLNKYSRES